MALGSKDIATFLEFDTQRPLKSMKPSVGKG
jgi:hypothetical protein